MVLPKNLLYHHENDILCFTFPSPALPNIQRTYVNLKSRRKMCHKKLYVKIANNDSEILLSIFSEEMLSLSKIENLNFYSIFVVVVGARKLKSVVLGIRHQS